MDLNYINSLISKAFYKGQKVTFCNYGENTIGVTLDGFVMYFMPEKDFIFDRDKLNHAWIDTTRFISTNGYEDAVRSNELLTFDKKTLAVFKNDNTEVFVDLKLLKPFDSRMSTYKIKDPSSGVLVYENGILVGLVMPTRYNRK